MSGDDRVRHCSECNLDVYNFSAMSKREIEHLLIVSEGRLCARWYRRSDGTILTRDCPVGFRNRIKRDSLIAGTALSALLGAAGATAETSDKNPHSLVTIENPLNGAGEVTVEVVDQSGALIPNAEVSIVDRKNHVVAVGETNQRGRFGVRRLPGGPYSVHVVAFGFKTETVDLTVKSGSLTQTSISVQMQVGALMGVIVEAPDGPDRESLLPDVLPVLLPNVLPVSTPSNARPKRSRIHRIFSRLYGSGK